MVSHNAAASRPKSRPNTHPCTWPDCHRLFACPHNVKQHIMEKHTFERPHVCGVCAAAGKTKAFARPYLLNRHQRQIHHMVIHTDRTRKHSRGQAALPLELARCDSPISFHNQVYEQHHPKIEQAFPLLQQQSFEDGWPSSAATAPIETYGQHFDEMKIGEDDHLHLSYHLPTASEGCFGSWVEIKTTGNVQVGGLPALPDYVYAYPQTSGADHMFELAGGINTIANDALSQQQRSNMDFVWVGFPRKDATPGVHHSRTNSSISGYSPGATTTDDLFSHSPDASSWM